MFRWAVCGLGKISNRWVKVANSLPNTRVIAAVSSSKERAIIYAKKYSMEHALTYEELAKNPSLVDAVYVCTHMNKHQETVEMFIKAGIPVLCEKSFALNSKQAKSMIDCAHKQKTLLMEAMWCRVLPANRYVNQIVKDKKYGDIIYTSGNFKAGWGHGPKSRVWQHDVGGGSVLDLAVYLVHYTQMLLGSPNSILASGKVIRGVDHYCDFEMKYQNGVVCELHSSLQFPTLKEAYKIYCEKGMIIVPSFYGARKVIEKPMNGKKIVTRFPNVDGFSYEIEHFMELIIAGKKESDILPLSITLEVIEMLENINRQMGVVF